MDTTPNLTIKATMHGPDPLPDVAELRKQLEEYLVDGKHHAPRLFSYLVLHIRSLTSRVQELEAGYVRPHFSPN